MNRPSSPLPSALTGRLKQAASAASQPPPRSAPLHVQGVTVAYDGHPVLRSVSLVAQPGELVGIVGPNGAGKTTLLRAILGTIRLDSGRVDVFGGPIRHCRRRIAYVPQTEAVDWDFPVTVFDVVMMGRMHHYALRLWPRAADRAAARRALKMVGMDELAHRHIRQLSGGQRQRAFIARALCQEAQLLLLDEPFAGIDAASEQTIFQIIDQLKADGRTLLVVNHDLGVLDRFDRVVLLNGHIIAAGPPQEAATSENLRRTYGGRLSLLERADAALRQQTWKQQ